jgi:hypothetical protein
MNELKTGALVCKSPDERNQYTYKALVFITGIPDNYSDEDLKSNLDFSLVEEFTRNCDEVLFRADVHSTSNEVQEEFEMLHDEPTVPQIQFKTRFVSI